MKSFNLNILMIVLLGLTGKILATDFEPRPALRGNKDILPVGTIEGGTSDLDLLDRGLKKNKESKDDKKKRAYRADVRTFRAKKDDKKDDKKDKKNDKKDKKKKQKRGIRADVRAKKDDKKDKKDDKKDKKDDKKDKKKKQKREISSPSFSSSTDSSFTWDWSE